MPELPEVETMRRGVEPVVGARIVAVEKTPCPRKSIAITPGLAALRRRIEGATIDRTDRAGKRVVLWLDTSDALVFEPRMTGLVLLADPPDPLYTRFRLTLRPASAPAHANPRTPRSPLRFPRSKRNPTQLLYWDRRGLGNIRLLTPLEYADAFGPHALGPDALAMTADLYRDRLGKSARPVKVALLDQQAVAGIGNLYAAEILHVARIHPTLACRRLTKSQWSALAAAAIDVLETAIRYEGSTLSDGTYKNALSENGGYQNEHRVYDKASQPCPRRNCRGVVERIVQAQRATFYCPACQRRR